MGKTSIEWATHTVNIITGCNKISPGCDNCYAERFAERWRGTPGHPYEKGFDLTFHPSRLQIPLNMKKPARIFLNSMADTFHKDIKHEFLDDIFSMMERADWHTFMVLTKRSSLMRDYVNARYEKKAGTFMFKERAPKHIWLGVSVENAAAKSRIKHLQDTAATVRFLSIEPLLEPLGELNLEGIHWVIVGGESGPGARPMNPAWVRPIQQQCERLGIPFFFKQWGEWMPYGLGPGHGIAPLGARGNAFSSGNIRDVGGVPFARVGKAKAGRDLDGRTWDEYPAQ